MNRFKSFLACLVLAVAFSSTAVGETSPLPLAILKNLPEYDMTFAPQTHHMLRLVKGKSRTLPVDGVVASVKVDKPVELRVLMMPVPVLRVLARHRDGITHFTALNDDGGVLMARYVFAAPAEVRYMRANIVCKAGETDPSCGTSKVYFCPDECFEMRVNLSE